MEIKARLVPDTWAKNGAHWFYGNSYMVKIRKSDAKKLCGMYPLPPTGCATVVAIKQEFWGKLRLEVQNISGDYMLASVNTPLAEWGSVFGVHIVM